MALRRGAELLLRRAGHREVSTQNATRRGNRRTEKHTSSTSAARVISTPEAPSAFVVKFSPASLDARCGWGRAWIDACVIEYKTEGRETRWRMRCDGRPRAGGTRDVC